MLDAGSSLDTHNSHGGVPMKTILAILLVLSGVACAHAKSILVESLEWLADVSPSIGIYTVIDPGRTGDRDRVTFEMELKLFEALKGQPLENLKAVEGYSMSPAQSSPETNVAAADRFLVFLTRDPEGTLRIQRMFNLSRPAPEDARYLLAIDAQFQVLTGEKAILGVVRDRLAANPSGSPLPQPGKWWDQSVEIPWDSPLLKRIWTGSSCGLMLPPDLAAPYLAARDIAGIVQSLKEYHHDRHTLPAGGNGKIIETLITTRKSGSFYLRLPSEKEAKFYKAGKYLDPWGTPYRIDTSKPTFPWAYSFGPNKIDEGGSAGSDDVASW
jgi:hypothetical protein